MEKEIKMATEPIVRIYTYNGFLIIDGPVKLRHKDWVPADKHTIGCIISNTKKYLEISKEALKVLKKVKRCGDAIGDFDWFKVDNEEWTFGWIGGPQNLKEISLIENGKLVGSRDFKIPGPKHYTIIENNPPKEACDAIDNREE